MWESLAAPLLGGLFGSSSASSAAAQQAAAAKEAEQGINRRFDISRQDQAPFMNTGYGANSLLAHLMGIKSTRTPQQLQAARESLLPQFTKVTPGGFGPVNMGGFQDVGEGGQQFYAQTPETRTVDEAGLAAALAQLGAEDQDPGTFGSLMKDFTEADIYADPIFKMAQKEAAGAVNERAMRGGMYDSGATLRELMKANSAVGTDAFNRWNTQQGTKFNRLSGLMGSGQQAVNQVGSLGAEAAKQSGEYLTQGGNVRAAGIVGGSNAWGNALSSWNQGQQRKQDQDFMRDLYGRGGIKD